MLDTKGESRGIVIGWWRCRCGSGERGYIAITNVQRSELCCYHHVSLPFLLRPIMYFLYFSSVYLCLFELQS